MKRIFCCENVWSSVHFIFIVEVVLSYACNSSFPGRLSCFFIVLQQFLQYSFVCYAYLQRSELTFLLDLICQLLFIVKQSVIVSSIKYNFSLEPQGPDFSVTTLHFFCQSYSEEKSLFVKLFAFQKKRCTLSFLFQIANTLIIILSRLE